MEVIFLTNNYLPTPNANGVCIHAIAKECVNSGHRAHVMCTGSRRYGYNDVIDGVNVHYLKNSLDSSLLLYYEVHRRSVLARTAQFVGRAIALSKKAIHIKDYPLRDNLLVRRYVKECQSIITKTDDVIVVASYTPIEAIKAGAQLKQLFPRIRTVYYSLDTLSNESGFGFLPEAVRTNMGLKQELKYFGVYDKILLMNCHKKHYEAVEFSGYYSKMMWADFPLFQPSADFSHDKTWKIVYTGTLYRGIRNPRPALDFLSGLLGTYSVHFYGHSDCDDIIEEYELKFPGHVVKHGLVSHQEAKKAASEADILLSIGNAHTQMAPSKIFEQMSTGKPIIHLYSEESDPCLPLLSEYGNALCVDATNVFNASFTSFINGLKVLSKAELNGKFHEASPKFTVKLITS